MIHVNKEHNEDPLKECTLKSLFNTNLENKDLKAKDEFTEVDLSINKESNAESSSSSEVKEQDVEKSFERLIIKELPKHLKYVFLEEEKSKIVIIATDLTME